MRTRSQFKITDKLLQGFCDQGMTVVEMAAKVKELSGRDCPVATIKNGCKTFGIDLRKKKRKSDFVFVVEEVSNGSIAEGNATHTF